MPFLILILALIAIGVGVWLNSRREMSRNEQDYLRRRGYAVADKGDGPPVSRDARLLGLIDSLHDLSPYSRQRAAETIAQMCEAGEKERRFYAPLIAALDDTNAPVRSAVAGALASLGDERAVAKLRRLAEADDSLQVRASARRAVERLSGKAQGQAL